IPHGGCMLDTLTMPGVEMRAQQAGLHTTLTHGPSGISIRTVPPKDNGGDASSFSPTDLFGASLGACMLTTMVLVAKREGIPPPETASAHLEKIMIDGPRRVGELRVRIAMPKDTLPAHRARLEEIARGCPVARSL